MTTCFSLFKQQHDAVLETLQSVESNWKGKHWAASFVQMEELLHQLKTHHASECELLFDRVRARHQMREGGPFCSYFFDFFMNNRPQARVEKMLSRILGKSVRIPIPQEIQSYFDEKSLFCIPLEEHLAVQALAQEILAAMSARDSTNMAWITESLSTLRDLIESNFKKEETCLWEAVRQIKDPLLQAELQTSLSPAG